MYLTIKEYKVYVFKHSQQNTKTRNKKKKQKQNIYKKHSYDKKVNDNAHRL